MCVTKCAFRFEVFQTEQRITHLIAQRRAGNHPTHTARALFCAA